MKEDDIIAQIETDKVRCVSTRLPPVHSSLGVPLDLATTTLSIATIRNRN